MARSTWPSKPAGGLAGVGRDFERREREQRRQEPDAHRIPAQRVEAQTPALGPAAQEEQRIGGVGSQEVAVDRGLAGALGFGDAFIRDGDRFVAPAEQVQDGGQVGVDAEQVVEATQLGCLVAGLAQLPDRRLGVLAPGIGHGEGAVGVERFLAGVVAHGEGHVQGVLGVPLRLGEDAFEHPELGHRREDAGPRLGGLRRHQLDGSFVGGQRAFVVAGRAPVVAELLHHEAQVGPFARVVEQSRGRLRVSRRAGGLSGANAASPARRYRSESRVAGSP